jgi:FkbM family methyltransferase
MKIAKKPIARLMESLAWRLFPHAEMSLAQPNGVRLSLQGRADIKILQEIFVEQGYLPFIEAMEGPVSTWVDVGCNCGMFSLYLEEYAREHRWQNLRKAVLIDPNRYAVATARRSLELSGVSGNFHLINAALAGKESSVGFYESKMTYKSSIFALKSKEKCRVVSAVDPYAVSQQLGGSIDLIKMDIEGGERVVLESWPDWFKCAKNVLIEWHEPHAPFEFVEQALLKVGFRRVLVLPPSYLKDDPRPAHTLPIGSGLWSRV